MNVGDTQPTLPLPDRAVQEPGPAPRRRSRWPWIIAAIVVVALAIAAWFAGEAIARGLVERTIRDEVVTRLALPADQEVDVQVPGAVLPQLIGGRFDEIRIASDAVTLGPLTGDVSVRARGVAIRGDVAADDASATLTLGEDDLRALMSTVDGFPADTLGLDAPDVTMSTEIDIFGLVIPVGAALTPSAADGDLVLTPASLQVAGADISADDLKNQFGIAANAVIRDWGVCIRKYIPAGITLTDARVVGETLVADLDIDGRIAADPALQKIGTCD